MFAEIAWSGTPSNATFIADIVAVLTGETDTDNLSDDIITGQQGTNIVSTIPAGWEVWDNSTGVNDEYVLRAPTIDDPTQYKYCKLKVTGSTTRTLSHSIMEGWDVGSNAPTNITVVPAFSFIRTPIFSFGDGQQRVTVMATARYIIIRATGYQFNTTFPCIEIDRINPSLAIGTGRVPAVTLDELTLINDNLTTRNTYMPRVLNDTGAVDFFGTSGIRTLATHQRPSCYDTSTEFDSLSTDVAYDSGGNPFYGLHLLLFEYRGVVPGIIGTSNIAKIWYVQAEVVTGFEDKTLHTLDTPDDLRCMWTRTNLVASGAYPRFFIEAE